MQKGAWTSSESFSWFEEEEGGTESRADVPRVARDKNGVSAERCVLSPRRALCAEPEESFVCGNRRPAFVWRTAFSDKRGARVRRGAFCEERRFGQACSGSERGWWFIRRRRDGAGSFVVVGENLEVPWRELFPELLGLPRRHVPMDGRRASGRKGSPFIFFLCSFGVCVCV